MRISHEDLTIPFPNNDGWHFFFKQLCCDRLQSTGKSVSVQYLALQKSLCIYQCSKKTQIQITNVFDVPFTTKGYQKCHKNVCRTLDRTPLALEHQITCHCLYVLQSRETLWVQLSIGQLSYTTNTRSFIRPPNTPVGPKNDVLWSFKTHLQALVAPNALINTYLTGFVWDVNKGSVAITATTTILGEDLLTFSLSSHVTLRDLRVLRCCIISVKNIRCQWQHYIFVLMLVARESTATFTDGLSCYKFCAASNTLWSPGYTEEHDWQQRAL